MKKTYEKAKIELIHIFADIITTSGDPDPDPDNNDLPSVPMFG